MSRDFLRNGTGVHVSGTAGEPAKRWVDYMPLDDLLTRRAHRNAKRHDAAGIAGSITEFGLAEIPTLDERTGRLVAGHGRLADLERRCNAGAEPPGYVDIAGGTRWLVPVLRGWTSRDDTAAEAYGLASNRLTETGGWDDTELIAMLRDLDAAEMMAVTGFTDADLEALLAAANDDSDAARAAAAPEEPPEPVVCPSCGHQFVPEPPDY